MSGSGQPSRAASKRLIAAQPSSTMIPTVHRSSMSTSRTESTLVPNSHGNEKPSTHQRFVFTDPVAFRYLEEDPTTQVLVRRTKLVGYETYLVEQWACSRTHPTFLITTYTGETAHEIICGVLSVPINEDLWSPRLKTYFDAIHKYHARRRETALGTIWITNLSAFPSSLTVIPVPEGDPIKYREDFFINENLKRLGCSGRTALTLAKPASSTVSKFYQLYRASEKIPFGQAVLELVKLCQVSLLLFDKLEPEYCDSLLCDMTEKALNDWWVEFGTEFYNIEPHDGILGPTTVAALMGLVMGARNRLHAYGAPVPKDVFEIEHMKRAIAYFQKAQRMPKTRRLDHATLTRLHRVTAKAANNEGWIVPRAIKGTVAELGGKGGEMVMDMVGARDKSGITEVETPDIDQFISCIVGARAKWLWLGKPRKGQSSRAMFDRLVSDTPVEFHSTSAGGYSRAGRRKESTVESAREGLDRTNTVESMKSKTLSEGSHRLSKRHTLDSAHKEHDSTRHLGRIKDAVSLRTHGSITHPKDDHDHDRSKDDHIHLHPVKSTDAGSQFSRNPMFRGIVAEMSPDAPEALSFQQHIEPPSDEERDGQNFLDEQIELKVDRMDQSSTASIAQSLHNDIDLDEIHPGNLVPDHDVGSLLRRRHSLQDFRADLSKQRHEAFWPRTISFSIAEDAILRWESINKTPELSDSLALSTTTAQLVASRQIAERALITSQRLLSLETTLSPWVQDSVSSVNRLISLARSDQETLDSLYCPRLEEYRALEAHSRGVIEIQKAQLEETVREIEVLGAKLEYEINALRSKVDDVEDGVSEFELQVQSLESRVQEMERDLQPKEGWANWLLRTTLGIGRSPKPK
ncbi:hypothetical protein, variant [Verruconis gallopava]|uniref:STB6-like N-terminal domain-containing protein n=1 Tax=Verruconis gallopava TaxID=253628 RepID=A0A0D2AQ23_9PEZI|nr:hypothetical protein, variant [Verruconis gallopava]KIW08590.1 hypothetical protein, variant [Verruconis gallopava]